MEPTKKDDELIKEILAKLGKNELDTEGLLKINQSLNVTQQQFDTLKTIQVTNKPFASAHELGEMVNNLDDPSLLRKNTETDEATRSCLIKLDGFRQAGIGDIFGELANTHMELMVSNARKGRSEKVTMTTGTKSINLAKPVFELFRRAKEEPKNEQASAQNQ